MDIILKEYQVNRVKLKSSSFNEKIWKEASVLTDFCSPWSEAKISKIEFRALWDLSNFYFQFVVYDDKIHIQKKDNSFDSIGNSDRVELFFRPDDKLSPYYCFEIDTSARIMDFEAYPNKQFVLDKNWNKKEIKVQSKFSENNFIVEGKISMNSLKKRQLIKDNKIEVGVFRAKYNKNKNGVFEPTWITWVNPNTVTPNFHVASSFGVFILKE